MSHEPTIDDEDYASSEDSDFAPEEAQERGDDASSDDEDELARDATAPVPVKRKRQTQAGDGDDAADAGFENSGDEAIIGRGKKKQKSRLAQRDEDEGGEGGLIKTRSMRAVEKAERKTQAASGPVTVNVDALWASMTADPVIPTKQQLQADPKGENGGAPAAPGDLNTQAATGKDSDPSEMIKIKRTYNFAGKVHTEEKLVQRDSAEARLYLASQGENGAAAAAEEADEPDKRMPRKAFRSAFEPVAVEPGQRSDLNLGMASRLQARQDKDKARKLNTVEKSRMDWAGFVDKEGIKDELALAGRAKGAFADRQDFLARSEARRDEEARRVRIASKV
ncbi:bucentaur or craniofacial development-domain-containing protein [Diaporthe sp. PMI_573]|nr:bucentaur or craniofacial development-domain-containing protein [Diaporthaceae sp. PMI_573]